MIRKYAQKRILSVFLHHNSAEKQIFIPKGIFTQMNKEKMTPQEIKSNIETKLSRYFGCTSHEASQEQMYKAVSMTVRDILTEKRGDFKKQVNKAGAKRVYYMCMEFLLGRSLKTNVCNLGMDKAYAEALTEMGFSKEQAYTTLELRMKCGVGKCGRCNIGSKYVCKDGPVFRCDEVDELPDEY